ncbi:hypothetical protein VST7929_03041 [Vibrio stylophorae]|uniref:Methyltransferase domain-containing protein n=1 Tax=Vibrio stylophorae TaxID=659351 RepID=A0ABN8DYY2_9VIBR|nr:class I SAM-dependent methyltransferase [Vibrio stylophorae]CAH0535467.1 hypothetical protein VST7929_03041 [Vibrio stylophorae]
MGISFAEPERLTLIFDADNRQEWQNTSAILEQLSLCHSDIIADIGAGTGYFSQLFSEQAHKVYAIDREPNMVTYLQNRFDAAETMAEVVPILSTDENPHLPDDANVIFIANTYRFVHQRPTFLTALKAQSMENARYMIVDFKGSHARVSPEQACEEVEHAGFRITHFDRITCPDHYILQFTR